MLKLLTKLCYKNQIFTKETKLFYKVYKWRCGLFPALQLRYLLSQILLGIIGIVGGIVLGIFSKSIIIGGVIVLYSIDIIIILIRKILQAIINDKVIMGKKSQIQTRKMEHFIRKVVSINGKALGRKEWKAIKEKDSQLYDKLLCEECNHCCYFYSLAIARIIKDSILIWGALEEPFEEGHIYYAHAVILRKGYVYDSNLRKSVKYEDFSRLYKFKTYKQWNYSYYSQEDFRRVERGDFRKWCRENNVLAYSEF